MPHLESRPAPAPAPAPQHPNPNPEPAPSYLLALPAELRIAIWEDALTEPGWTRLTPTLKLPALLQTNRQIAHETSAIWFRRSKFEFYIVDCEATILHKFQMLIRSLRLRAGEPGQKSWLVRALVYNVRFTRAPVWANMLAWCKQIWDGGFTGLRREDALDLFYFREIVSVHEMTRLYMEEGRTWEECRRALEILRHATNF